MPSLVLISISSFLSQNHSGKVALQPVFVFQTVKWAVNREMNCPRFLSQEVAVKFTVCASL